MQSVLRSTSLLPPQSKPVRVASYVLVRADCYLNEEGACAVVLSVFYS